jgi:hypothetical protein
MGRSEAAHGRPAKIDWPKTGLRDGKVRARDAACLCSSIAQTRVYRQAMPDIDDLLNQRRAQRRTTSNSRDDPRVGQMRSLGRADRALNTFKQTCRRTWRSLAGRIQPLWSWQALPVACLLLGHADITEELRRIRSTLERVGEARVITNLRSRNNHQDLWEPFLAVSD